VGPYRFFFFSNEGDESANFPAHELGAVRGLVIENHAKLIEAWHEYFSR